MLKKISKSASPSNKKRKKCQIRQCAFCLSIANCNTSQPSTAFQTLKKTRYVHPIWYHWHIPSDIDSDSRTALRFAWRFDCSSVFLATAALDGRRRPIRRSGDARRPRCPRGSGLYQDITDISKNWLQKS